MTPESKDSPSHRVTRTLEKAGVILVAMLLAAGCIRLKSGAHSQVTEYMDTADHRVLLKVPAEKSPSPHFVLDGKPFCFAGTNNYYLTYKSPRMVDDVFDSAVDMGIKVVRLWGFQARGSLDGSVKNVDGDGTKDGIYFQYWDTVEKRPALNQDPATGLPKLDYVLSKARKSGVKVILVLTNNWHEMGGVDQYVQWYGLKYHDQFYTDERARTAFKDYAKALIERKNSIDGTLYRDDPAIFAWELGNELRCKNSGDFDRNDGWDHSTLPKWADEMSSYIKSLDPNHLVAMGDEGFLRIGGSWLYEGHEGVDNAALTALPNIDFGTFHLYPEDWGTGFRFGQKWIEEHLKVGQKLGKPTVLEEYGVLVRRDAKGEISKGWDKRELSYRNWNEVMLQRGGAAALFWMLSGVDDKGQKYPDYDHYQVYKGDRTAKLLAPYIRRFNESAGIPRTPGGAQACQYPAASYGTSSPFVRTSRTSATSAEGSAK